MKTTPDTSTDYQEILGALFTLSKKMLDHARAGEWLLLTEAERQRQDLMGKLAAAAGNDLRQSAADVELIREKLQSILNVNAAIMELGHEACREFSRRLRVISGGRQARKAYLENSI